MGACHINGNADLYGLGIRLGYYLQWYSRLLAPWICPSEVEHLRLANSFFVTSTFFALLARGKHANEIEVVEIYITLLFTLGSYLYLLPVSLWRIMTRCDPRYDPSRFSTSPSASKLFIHLQNVILMAVLSFQVGFWTKTTTRLKNKHCEQYGFFFFSKVPLTSAAFRTFNLALTLILLLLIGGFLVVTPWADTVALKLRIKDVAAKTRGNIYPTKETIFAFRVFNTSLKVVIASMMILATELYIEWNAISNVNTVSSTSQIVPLTIGIGSTVRMLYIACRGTFVDKWFRRKIKRMVIRFWAFLPGICRSHNGSLAHASTTQSHSKPPINKQIEQYPILVQKNSNERNSSKRNPSTNKSTQTVERPKTQQYSSEAERQARLATQTTLTNTASTQRRTTQNASSTSTEARHHLPQRPSGVHRPDPVRPNTNTTPPRSPRVVARVRHEEPSSRRRIPENTNDSFLRRPSDRIPITYEADDVPSDWYLRLAQAREIPLVDSNLAEAIGRQMQSHWESIQRREVEDSKNRLSQSASRHLSPAAEKRQ